MLPPLEHATITLPSPEMSIEFQLGTGELDNVVQLAPESIDATNLVIVTAVINLEPSSELAHAVQPPVTGTPVV